MLGSIDLKDWKRDQQRKIDSDDQCSIFKHVEHERDISCCASIEKVLQLPCRT